MKRKSILWGWLVLVMAMIGCWAITACDDDKKEDPQNPLFGAWEATCDEATIEHIEQMIVATLAQEGELPAEAIEALNHAKDIIAVSRFVVQFNSDGTVRLYSYKNGVGPFVSGTWTMTDQALILKVAGLQLPITNLQTDGKTLNCNIGELPLTFKRYQS